MNSDLPDDLMRILCVTPWFPASPGEHSGNFILDSVDALAALGNSVKVLVTQPWLPEWLDRILSTSSTPAIHIDAHNKSLGVEVVHYPSIPGNYFQSLSNIAYRKTIE